MYCYILIIENEELVREALVDILNLAGWTTVEAANGRDAITTFQEHHQNISLVVMDMRLPDMYGTEILENLEAIQPDIQVVVVSGEEKQKLIRQFKSHSNVSILIKPYDIDEMVEHVRRHLPPNHRPSTAQ